MLILSAALCACAITSSAKSASITRQIYLTNQNTVIMSESIDMVSVDGSIAAVIGKRMMLPSDQQLYIVVISPGGDPRAAYLFSQFMKDVPHTSLICKYCASASGMIFANGNNRLAIKKSEMVMHEMYMNHITANIAENPEFAQNLKRSSDAFNELIYSVIGMSKLAYEKKILNTAWNVNGAELVKLHLADELVKLQCDQFEYSLLPDTCS